MGRVGEVLLCGCVTVSEKEVDVWGGVHLNSCIFNVSQLTCIF